MSQLYPARLIAFYLPQYHPIPENNQFWGEGFTEWTNVTKAKPLFPGHHQPKLPSDLGFYDLRVPEVRLAQVALAQAAGIEAFCYWHYWFGNGKRVMNSVFDEVLASKKPNFPFCLAWANESWTGVWHGMNNRVLIEQQYGGIKDFTDHFYTVLPAFQDKRYVKVEGCPLFLIYKPKDLPSAERFTNLWRELAVKEGLKGIHFVATYYEREQLKFGADAFVSSNPWSGKHGKASVNYVFNRAFETMGIPIPELFNYKRYVRLMMNERLSQYEYPVVVPNWDNTPRSKYRGKLFYNSSPQLYEQWLKTEILKLQNRPLEKRLVFLKSWNEWAEGNFLEPSRKYGHQYLEATRNALLNKK